LLGSCSAKTDEFSEFKTIPGNKWVYGNTLAFTPEHVDSVVTGPLFLTLRHDDSYPYANICLELKGKMICDTLNITLADVYGNWLGKGYGANREITIAVSDRYTHSSGDTLFVRHILRTDTLSGISLVGLQLNP